MDAATEISLAEKRRNVAGDKLAVGKEVERLLMASRKFTVAQVAGDGGFGNQFVSVEDAPVAC
jgi:hypothetical protein